MSDKALEGRSQQLATRIFDAFQAETLVDPVPFLGLPLGEGFLVQAENFRRLDRPLKGSKLTLKGGVCQSAPLLFVSEDERHHHQPGMFIEVEIACVLGRDIARTDGPVTRSDIVDAISSLRIGVELLRSRYVEGARGDGALAVADMMSNIGYILGPELGRDLLREDAVIGQLSIAIGGETVFDQPAVHAETDHLKAVVVLANQAPISPFDMLKAGQVITTGTLCGLVPVSGPARVEIALPGRTCHFDLA